MSRASRHRVASRPHLEPLEDRRLLSTCNVVRKGDFGGGHAFGNFARGDLRYCINLANNNPGPDTIDFAVTGTIQLNSQLPHLASDITMIGPGADLLAVRGTGKDAIGNCTIFIIESGTVAISGLTMTNGFTDAAGPGGIMNYDNGTLSLKDCTVTGNYYYYTEGGGGGGIRNRGKMTISGCTISNNEVWPDTDGYGGGIYNQGEMLILNSTISGNHVLGTGFAGYGGGIFNHEGSLEIRSSTITNNTVGGGGCCGDGAGIEAWASVQLYNTIVAGNTGGSQIEGSYTGSANLIGGDPMLGPLQYNGGHTQTHAVLPGSPALDAGDNTGAPDWDQRGPGFPRIVNGTIDIGAFEVQATGSPGVGNHDLAVLMTADFTGDTFDGKVKRRR